MLPVLRGLRARLNERSTYLFITAGMGSVTVLPGPFNWIGFALLLVAAFVPDGPVRPPCPPQDGGA
ncbi:MAG TPA: hypothetical protein VN222_10635 [Novosphingobium sp.]|nr:hypothetical protein [Novosphingobium sp.]